MSAESDYKLRSLKYSTIAIATVVFVEVILGLTVNSLAIISDGMHASLDAVTTLVLFLATRASLKPPDEEHMYGHEKFESIGGLTGGIALIGIALLIMYEAITKIIQGLTINQGLEYMGFIAIGYTFCIDFFRVGTFFRARKSESSTMKAGFYHAIADLSSTVIALLGFGLATLGFFYGDSLASIVLSIFLSYLSVRLVWSSAMELSDTISKDVADKVRNEILSTSEIVKLEHLKIRRAGEKTFIRATVQVPDYLDFEKAHELTSQIEANIKRAIGNADVTIHTHPSETEMPTAKLVEKLAREIEDVKEVHEVNLAFNDGKLYIALHAYVDPKLSIEKAHAIAEQIENKMKANVKDVEDITVHMEPFTAKKRRGSMVDEGEIRKLIYETVETDPKALRIRRIITYVSGKKRYINIDCSFSKQISIEEAHSIASEIEDNIRIHFSETVITVHVEPEQA